MLKEVIGLDMGSNVVGSNMETIELMDQEGWVKPGVFYRLKDVKTGEFFTARVVDQLGNKLSLRDPSSKLSFDYEIPPHIKQK